ncbi:hypothetical protein F2Q70_00009126 [Brassica cretica]|uniref:Uncharacterized protein n=1 Tax=Brassica cretica TaxID=69181 RepID=A0A8S9M5H4_BRACR|nr:hypothetical protein F2Q70_00009126 [Brassica cretica]
MSQSSRETFLLSKGKKNAGKLKLRKKYYATSSRKRLFNLSSKRFSSDETTEPASSNPPSGVLNGPHPTLQRVSWTDLVQLAIRRVGSTMSNSPSGELDQLHPTRHQATWINPTPCTLVSLSGTLSYES